MHTKTDTLLIPIGWSNTFFYFQKDIIPPGIHTAGIGLGIAMQHFQNACYFKCTLNKMSSTICFNLDQSNILSFGKGLRVYILSAMLLTISSSAPDKPISNHA